jgi:cystathionine beta-lyase/cystathionine gamma-synthase
MSDQKRFATRAIHAGQEPDPTSGAIMPPIYQTSTYVQPALGQPKLGYEYARVSNPTRDALQANVAALEGGRHGAAFASGLAAIEAVVKKLSAGDHVVSEENTYGGTTRMFNTILARLGIEFTYVDSRSVDALRAAIRPETRLIHLETPTNPSRGAGPGQRDHDGRGQHVRLAIQPAAAGAGDRRSGPFNHEIPERSQRRGGRDGRHQR